MDIERRIREIEDELKNTKYNKATEKHILKLKARLTYLKKEMEERARKERKIRRERGIKKSGNATVSLIGPPSVGKSYLFNILTNAKSEVGDYAFTTLNIYPGILKYKGAEIQILDMPGLIKGASKGRGNGREILSTARNSDLLIILLDVYNLDLDTVLGELYEFGIRVNEEPPNITIRKKDRGGIKISSTGSLKIDEETLISITREFGYTNAEITIREEIDFNRYLDFLAGNRIYIPGILAVNKVDLIDEKTMSEIRRKFETWKPIMLSAKEGYGIENLKEKIFKDARLIRVFLKPQSGKVDYDEPLILKKGATVEDVCKAIHRDFVEKFRYGMVWGKSVKFPGQHVGLEHRVEDGDIIRLVMRK